MPDTSDRSGGGGLTGLVMLPFTAVPALVNGLRSLPRLAAALEELVTEGVDRLSLVADDLATLARAETTTAVERLPTASEAPERFEEALTQLAEMRRTLEMLAADFRMVPAHVDRAAGAVERTNEYLEVALPVMQNLAAVAAPLAGTSERLGHLVDRFPKRRGSRAGRAAVPPPGPSRTLPG